MEQEAILEEFVQITKDLLGTEQVQSMAQWGQHGKVSCLAHSLFVATTAHKMAKRLGMDTVATARGALLHDLYLYHKRDRSAHSGIQCFDHPKIAAKNAAKITKLTDKEENIILSHMWPLGAMPKSPEAVLVNLADTFCAVVEFLNLFEGDLLVEKVSERLEERIEKKLPCEVLP